MAIQGPSLLAMKERMHDSESQGAKWQRGRMLKPRARADAARAKDQRQTEGLLLFERDEVGATWAQQKLVYDELLRYQRSRAADVETLLALQQQIQIKGDTRSNSNRMKQHAACRFREDWRIGESLVVRTEEVIVIIDVLKKKKWRIGREDGVLETLERDQAVSNNQDCDDLRLHLK